MIGPLALRPCALLRAWGFCHIWHFMRSPLRPLVRPCIFFASILMLSKSYLPRRCDWKGVVFYKSPYLCRGLDSFWFSLPSPFCIVTFYLAINLWGSSTNRPTKQHSTASTPMLEDSVAWQKNHLRGFNQDPIWASVFLGGQRPTSCPKSSIDFKIQEDPKRSNKWSWHSQWTLK